MNILKSIKKYIYNQYLVLRFPFIGCDRKLLPTWTIADELPIGWRKTLLIPMLSELKRASYGDKDFSLFQLDEKDGVLIPRYVRSTFLNDDIDRISEKYEYISQRTCIECGAPAHYLAFGTPYCDKCINGSIIKRRCIKFYTKENKWYGYYRPTV